MISFTVRADETAPTVIGVDLPGERPGKRQPLGPGQLVFAAATFPDGRASLLRFAEVAERMELPVTADGANGPIFHRAHDAGCV